MKVKIPKEIKIGEHAYFIHFDKDLIRDEGDRGRITWHTKNVTLRNLICYQI